MPPAGAPGAFAQPRRRRGARSPPGRQGSRRRPAGSAGPPREPCARGGRALRSSFFAVMSLMARVRPRPRRVVGLLRGDVGLPVRRRRRPLAAARPHAGELFFFASISFAFLSASARIAYASLVLPASSRSASLDEVLHFLAESLDLGHEVGARAGLGRPGSRGQEPAPSAARAPSREPWAPGREPCRSCRSWARPAAGA